MWLSCVRASCGFVSSPWFSALKWLLPSTKYESSPGKEIKIPLLMWSYKCLSDKGQKVVRVINPYSWWLLERSRGDTSESPARPRVVEMVIQINFPCDSTWCFPMDLHTEILLSQRLSLFHWVLELRRGGEREAEDAGFQSPHSHANHENPASIRPDLYSFIGKISIRLSFSFRFLYIRQSHFTVKWKFQHS